MLIRKRPDILYSAVTPKSEYLSRRRFLAGTAAGLVLPGPFAYAAKLEAQKSSFSTSGAADSPQGHHELQQLLRVRNRQGGSRPIPPRKLQDQPWQVSVEGLCAKAGKVRHRCDSSSWRRSRSASTGIRCVEAWSMVMPWIGFPLVGTDQAVGADAKAKYVEFETLLRLRSRCPGAARSGVPLARTSKGCEWTRRCTRSRCSASACTARRCRIRTARRFVSWCRGSTASRASNRSSRSGSSTSSRSNTWKIMNRREYGFYSNVNPQVDHPRWTQATERRIGEFFKRKTLMFNGYADQVASPVSGDGSQEILLKFMPSPIAQPLVEAGCIPRLPHAARVAAGQRRSGAIWARIRIEYITRATGDWTMRFLLITLSITPLRRILARSRT